MDEHFGCSDSSLTLEFSKRTTCEHLSKVITQTPFSTNITFEDFNFTYDNAFFQHLNALTKQLKRFATVESQLKSRTYGPNIHQFNKQELIREIKRKIQLIDHFEEIKDNKSKPNASQDIRNSSQTQLNSIDSNNSSNTSNASDNTINYYNSEQTNVGLDVNLTQTEFQNMNFTQQFVYSNGFNNSITSNYSNDNFSFNHNNHRNDCIACDNSFCFECSYNSDDENLNSFNAINSYNYSSDENSYYCENDCDPYGGNNSNDSISDDMECEPNYSSHENCPESNSDLDLTSGTQALRIVNRHKWANTVYNLETGIRLIPTPKDKKRTQHRRQQQMKFILQRILGLIENDFYCTKRDLYYQNVLLFNSSQRVVDEIVDDLACSLRVSRQKLNIISSTRGLVFGHLRFNNTNGKPTDCLHSPNGINIPNETEKLSHMKSEAEFVLFIEKDATFQQLIELKIHTRYPIIMVTGHGYPDMNTRAFLQILWNTFNIPIFGLVDGNAHGVEILCTCRHGSLALSYESPNLVVPAIKWLGILPSDIGDYNLSKEVQIPLRDSDRKKIQDLKRREYMIQNKLWTKQLDILLQIGTKVEIQSLAKHSPTFLLDVYLPSKIRYGKWI